MERRHHFHLGGGAQGQVRLAAHDAEVDDAGELARLGGGA